MSYTLPHDIAELGEVPAQGVDQLGALAHEDVARTKHHGRCLRLRTLALNEPHRRALRRLADRLRVSHVVLLPLHERLHVRGRDEPRIVAQSSDLAGPVVRARASLHRHDAPWQRREEHQNLVTPQLLAQDRVTAPVRAVNLENRLGQIDADCADLPHGRLLQW